MRAFLQSGQQLRAMAWPVFIGQVAVLAFSTVDTLMLGRLGSQALAALAVGSAAYVTVFVGLMGVVLAIGPIAGRLFGAQQHAAAGAQLQQAQWLALLLALPGMALLAWPEPFVRLAGLEGAVAAQVRAYLGPMALALLPALLFTAFRGFNTAISRPKAVMALQVGALALKVPLTALLVFGGGPIPGLGAAGCGWATAIAMSLQWLAAHELLRRDPYYRPFALGRWLDSRPQRAALMGLVRLGLPMGGSILVEVTGFTFMAFFIARLGANAVAGHQIAVNLVSMMFMLPLALSSAATALVAQALGARDLALAQRLGRHALIWGLLVAALAGGLVALLREPIVRLYTHDTTAAAAALPLLVWVWFFHIGDAVQTVCAGVLRAHHVATLPMVIYVLALWGVGIGGGYTLAFGLQGTAAGALGFWWSATFGLALAALLLSGLQLWVERQLIRSAAD
ncbi:MATE family multidrug resistance protein [Inhella inkyongensis]|uniref:Multidrug-efflux transporter n=1 Tax=Inhella inkyongensis TaxID=392593 RepID=A0A840SDQ5_9BURK|nr:MATE family efflux transporter [Inhella inkyongensis]MBB5206419.1 MATE family multidrug resistance protein [Inhella inkyongensis]